VGQVPPEAILFLAVTKYVETQKQAVASKGSTDDCHVHELEKYYANKAQTYQPHVISTSLLVPPPC
jgi:hypothetical protein